MSAAETLALRSARPAGAAGRSRVIVLTALPLPQALGLPPETPLIDCGLRGALTIRGGRRCIERETRDEQP